MFKSAFAVAMALFSFTAFLPAEEASTESLDFKAKPSEIRTYKTIGDVELEMSIFYPADHKPSDQRAVIVFFFGGGWKSGTPAQFYPHCNYLASRGMVAMAADYRVYNRQKAQVIDCIADAKSAIRWVRANAKKLGIDPNRIASGGGSAGGHLGAAVGTLSGFETEGEDTSISSRPNAMALFNPALDLSAKAFNAEIDSERYQERLKRQGAKPDEISPTQHISKNTPPAIIFHGKEDPTVPYSQAEAFTKRMKEFNIPCTLDGYEKEKHGFFNYGRNGNKAFVATLRQLDLFLVEQKFLSGKATIK